MEPVIGPSMRREGNRRKLVLVLIALTLIVVPTAHSQPANVVSFDETYYAPMVFKNWPNVEPACYRKGEKFEWEKAVWKVSFADSTATACIENNMDLTISGPDYDAGDCGNVGRCDRWLITNDVFLRDKQQYSSTVTHMDRVGREESLPAPIWFAQVPYHENSEHGHEIPGGTDPQYYYFLDDLDHASSVDCPDGWGFNSSAAACIGRYPEEPGWTKSVYVAKEDWTAERSELTTEYYDDRGFLRKRTSIFTGEAVTDEGDNLSIWTGAGVSSIDGADRYEMTLSDFDFHADDDDNLVTNSYIRVVNTSTSSATMRFRFRRFDGSVAHETTRTLAGHGTESYNIVNNFPDLPDGRFALQIASDQPLSVNVDYQRSTGSGPVRFDGHPTWESGVDEAYFPLSFVNFWKWNSVLVIHNIDGAKRTARVEFYSNDGILLDTVDYDIAGYGSRFLDLQFNAPSNIEGSGDPSSHTRGFNGAIKVVETGSHNSLVAALHTHTRDGKAEAYVGASSSSQYIPDIFADVHDGWTTDLWMYNSDSASNTVTLRYSDVTSRTVTIPAFGSTKVEEGDGLHAGGWRGTGWVTNADNWSAVRILVQNDDRQPGSFFHNSYYTNVSNDSSEVWVPFLNNDFHGWNSSIVIQNTSGAPQTVEWRYACDWGTVRSTTLDHTDHETIWVPGDIPCSNSTTAMKVQGRGGPIEVVHYKGKQSERGNGSDYHFATAVQTVP